MPLLNPKKPALSRFSTFGLREEWIALFLERPLDWASSGLLGPKQIDALRSWLKVAWLIDEYGNETELTRSFRSKGRRDLETWQLVWVSIANRFTTANWYCKLPCRQYSTSELRATLQADYPLSSPRTVSNAVNELVSTLQQTPIGAQLGQGNVTTRRARIVTRKPTTMPTPTSVWCSFALTLYDIESKTLISDNICWPWHVFGCDRESVLTVVRLYGEHRLIEDNGVLHIVTPPKEWDEWRIIATS